MRIGKRWASCLAMGLFLLCVAGLVWLLAAETVPNQQPVRLTPEAVSGAPELDGLYLYAGPLELEYTLPVHKQADLILPNRVSRHRRENCARFWRFGNCLRRRSCGWMALPFNSSRRARAICM